MSTDLAIPETRGTVTVSTWEKAREYIGQARAENTKRAYRADWADFTGWCSMHGLPALPAAPETVIAYLTEQADIRKISTLQRRICSISKAHQVAGHESPTKNAHLKEMWAGIRRNKGVAQSGKAPAVTADVRAMTAALPDNLLGKRDRALLLVGFAGAFRRGEIVALDVADLVFGAEGVTVTLRRSKTDQEGEGRKVGVPFGARPETCPVRALTAWLEAAGIEDGSVFRAVNRHGQMQPGRLSDKAVARVVKRQARACGLDPARYAGHSLRAGLATSAAAAGVQERAIMAQTGHRSEKMVRRYIREGSLFRENAAAAVGL